MQRFWVLSHAVILANLIEEEMVKACPRVINCIVVAVAQGSIFTTTLDKNSKFLLRKQIYYAAHHGELLEAISVYLVDDVDKEFKM